MSSTAWDEIKRLAADFQRVQLTSSHQKLSERNCIEIISKLEKLGLLKVYHTNDGKEYITPEHLTKEIEDELFVRGGRVNLTELVNALGVDLSIIEKRATALANRGSSNTYLVLGNLVSKHYLDTIAEEINERLMQAGCLNLVNLVKKYDLPENFLSEAIVERLGSIIQGQQDTEDQNLFFNDAFLVRHQAHVRGVLSAITKPTKVSTIINQHGLQERLFFNVAEKLIATRRVLGIMTGNRQLHMAMYIPHIYSRTQKEWVDNFWKQNGYLELDGLRRIGIDNPEAFVRRHLKDVEMTFVGNVCVGPVLIDQIEGAISDAVISGKWVDVYPILPSMFSPEEGNQLVEIALKKRQDTKSKTSSRVLCDTIVVSEQLVTKLTNELQQLMPARAKEAIEQGVFKVQVTTGKVKDESSKNKKDDRRKKAAGGKSGGGTQGRETKTKAVKNKHKGRKGASRDSDSEDDTPPPQPSGSGKFPHVEFLSLEDLQTEISNFSELVDCPEELVEALATELNPGLTRQFQDVAQTAFLATVSAGSDARKKTHQQLVEKVSALLTTIRLAEKSLKVFDEEKQIQLKKHLLKTQCSEIINELLIYLADESHLDISKEKDITPEIRQSVIKNLPDDTKEVMMTAHKTLAAADIDEFMDAADEAIAAAGLMLKKKDNKKDRQVLQNHRCALLDQLDGSLDAPLTLHLACLLLFQSVTGNMLHASGKFVPHILSYVKSSLPADQFAILQDYQDLVIKSLVAKDDENTLGDIKLQLETLTPKVKEIAITYKKSNTHNDE
ncbi:E3 UFM1-protein ligase 1-like [Penaeus indicus]|uniref:E3 UFM1-protein ligase 1-like n=1 Tax=Penaeus indicus TaxID=29960 RepID=UPI00300C2B45